MISDLQFDCPHCLQHLACSPRMAGRQIECPKCNHLIRVPPSPGKTSQYQPESGRTWDTVGPSAKIEGPKGLRLKKREGDRGSEGGKTQG